MFVLFRLNIKVSDRWLASMSFENEATDGAEGNFKPFLLTVLC